MQLKCGAEMWGHLQTKINIRGVIEKFVSFSDTGKRTDLK